MKLTVIFSLLIVSACSVKKNELANQTQNGHEELYSEPNKEIVAKSEGRRRIIIAATNDIGGALGTQAIKIRDNHNKDPLHIEVGGVDFLASYLTILRTKYKSVVLVDSGDFLPQEADDYPEIRSFYSLLDYAAAVPGLSDLSMRCSDGENPVKKFAQDSKVPVLTSNLYELKTARGIEWKGTSAYQLHEVNGVKIGILGLLPDDLTTLTPLNNRVGLYVENMLQSTLHQARRLRSLGAQVIVVLTHQGLNCGTEIAEASKLPLSKVNFEPSNESICDLNGQLGTYLKRLPAKLVDVVVAGRNHKKTANIINGIAVVSGFDSGKSFTYVEVALDEKTGKTIPEEVIVHQPVMICREFFKETNDCYTEDPSVNHLERIPPKFLGVPVERNEEIRKKFKKFFDDVSVGLSPGVDEIRKKLSADIVYKESTGGSHLVMLNLTGTQLSTWLERSYNLENRKHWSPDPFRLKSNELTFLIHGYILSNSKTYKVLTDVESLQKHTRLQSYITSNELQVIPQLSWNTATPVDEVSMASAGPAR